MKKAFTLLELMIVIIIIGVLAGFGVPQFFKSVEKGRMAEGTSLLGSYRSAQLRYYAEKAVFTTVAASLDLDTTTPRYFNIALLAPAYSPTAIIASATRNAFQRPSGFDYRLEILVNGNITCTNITGSGCASLGY